MMMMIDDDDSFYSFIHSTSNNDRTETFTASMVQLQSNIEGKIHSIGKLNHPGRLFASDFLVVGVLMEESFDRDTRGGK